MEPRSAGFTSTSLVDSPRQSPFIPLPGIALPVSWGLVAPVFFSYRPFLMNLPPMKMGRSLDGISAVLLPFTADGKMDLESYVSLLERTWTAGLTPAVNMDTGYVNLLSVEERGRILSLVSQQARGRRFVAGAYIEGLAGDPSHLYIAAAQAVTAAGGIPVLFPCSALAEVTEQQWVSVFRQIAGEIPQFIGFELSPKFVPFGRIWELDTYRALLDIPQFVGSKHSSLSRQLEWDRLALRNSVRPDFRVYTGNDLAIDMIQWGSDYLLGLSAFHVESFAQRDRLFALGDSAYLEVNDWLQYLGMFAFREPVPAYKHTCAQFLKLRGLLPCDHPHPRAVRRPESDLPVLAQILEQLDHRCR